METDNQYKNGKIYKLINDTTDLVYYGSTTKSLNKRLSWHLGDYNKFIKGKHNYVTSFKLYENDSVVSILLVENVNCETKKELHERERYYIENNECVNKVLPSRTREEYLIDNKDYINNSIKKYREKNHDKLLKYYKEYDEKNSSKRQEYRDQNRTKRNDYYLKNRERINENKKKNIVCECGRMIQKTEISRHNKSKIHIDLMKSTITVEIT
jgi:hypothetical protein